MKLFFKYIFQYWKNSLIFMLFTVVFATVFALYNVHTEAVLYAFLICLVIGIFAVIFGFMRFRKKHLLLCEIYENLPIMVDSLPHSNKITEEKLNSIIKRLIELNYENTTRLKYIQQNNFEYFTVWVHQIKTPISAVQMILQSEDISAGSAISAELFHIEQYTEMALQYIRLDSDSSDFVITNYSLDLIIRQAVRRYAPLFIRRKLSIDYQPADAEIITDEKWLCFVVEQLLSNGVKYTVKGCISIRFKNDILSVSDTGIGISPEDLPRIFEKGYTGMIGRMDKKSTGLGLYLCKKICNKLGHKLYAESEVGKGTTVYIDLSRKQFDIE